MEIKNYFKSIGGLVTLACVFGRFSCGDDNDAPSEPTPQEVTLKDYACSYSVTLLQTEARLQ